MQPFNILLTGLSGAGKTTLAFKLQEYLNEQNIANEVLDGDVYRAILSPDAGYTKEERKRFGEKVLYIAKLLNKHNVSCVLPFLSASEKFRDEIHHDLENLMEVYVKCPIEVCMDRDPKGLYKRKKMGEESNIVGIDLPYDEPESPDLVIETDTHDIEACTEAIIGKLQELQFIDAALMNS